MPAHSGGMLALDIRGDLVATAGYGMRHGRVVVEPLVKIFDLRAMPRLLTSIPFHAGPTMLAFHPKFSASLLIASASGAFTLADTGCQGFSPTYQASMRSLLAPPCTSRAIACGSELHSCTHGSTTDSTHQQYSITPDPLL